jgi:ABC-2 type transport system permease protein
VNGQHFRAFVWLRWRLFVNQMGKAGLANTIILAILAIGALFLALMTFVGAFVLGVFAMPEAEPAVHMFVWDGLALAFLFCWTTGVFAELQKSEALALDKFLHLPVSLWSAFLLNYLSSLLSVTLILFLPAMIGLILGMAIGVGADMLLDLLLLAGFLLMITAVTYQFQGWLATLMVDKRRRRNVIVIATLLFVGIAQLPNVVNLYFLGGDNKKDSVFKKLDKHTEAENKELMERADSIVSLINMVLPPGWLALGTKAVAQRDWLTGSMCLFGMTLLGTASLRRAYRTTLRLYTGQFTAGGQKPPAAATVPSVPGAKPARNWLEIELPWVSEPVAVIALGAFRSFLRAPEVKMLLLSPILMLVIFGGIFLRNPADIPGPLRPMLMYGGLCMVLLFVMNLLNNQFGFDRSGFRIFVLAPTSRAAILLGKNLAVVPFALGLGILVIGCLQVFYPARLDHLLAVPAQAISMFLLYCLLANCLSILAPIRMNPGAMKAADVKLMPLLLHLLFFFTFPLVVSPTLLPLAFENILGFERVPVCLILSIVECVGVVYLYRWVLVWEGRFLQMRELHILETVTTKNE